MTTKEAAWLAKKTAQGVRVNVKYNDISCVNVTDDDLMYNFKYISEHGLLNPYMGIYTWYNKELKPVYSMCIKDEKCTTIYQCNINDIQIVREEKAVSNG